MCSESGEINQKNTSEGIYISERKLYKSACYYSNIDTINDKLWKIIHIIYLEDVIPAKDHVIMHQILLFSNNAGRDR
jgi:hypothetical protein